MQNIFNNKMEWIKNRYYCWDCGIMFEGKNNICPKCKKESSEVHE